MKKRILAIFLALISVLALLTACGKENAEPTDPTEGTSLTEEVRKTERAIANELTVGIAQDLDESLDPHYTVAAGTREVMFNVFEGLVKPDANGNLVPAIAETVTVSEDGLTYTFTLRQNVKFHNGKLLTMGDVLFSLDRNRGAEGSDPLIPALTGIANVENTETALTLTLVEPNPEFLANLTFAIIPEDYEDQATAPVGTGPFKFVSRVAQDNIVLEKFEDYYGAPAFLNKVTYKIIENAEGLLLGLQSGALDLVSHLTITQAKSLRGDDFNIEEGTMNLVQALYLNNAAAPFDDIRVRQALSYGINKQDVLDLAFDGFGHPLGSSMYPAFGKYFDESLTDFYSYDLEKAKSLLADAGYPDGFEMTITVPSNYEPHVNTAEVLAELLKDLGITAKIQPVEWGTWVDDVYGNRNFQTTVIGFDTGTLTARGMLERFTSTHSKNLINYKNEEYDALFEQALKSFDDAEQTALYRAMERNLTENAANLYIQDMADMVAVRKGLTGLTFYPLYVLDVSTLYWEK